MVGPLELANVRQVEAFASALGERFPRLHILINNAAQTLTREAGWFVRMDRMESVAAERLPPAARQLVSCSEALLLGSSWPAEASTSGGAEQGGACGRFVLDDATRACSPAGAAATATDGAASAEASGSGGDRTDRASAASAASAAALAVASGPPAAADARAVSSARALSAAELAAFPEGKLDETLQPLDLTADNSWSRRLGEVPTTELLHTLAANAVAPFVLCGALRPLLAAPADDADAPYGHIINVSALEGKFSVGKKGAGHPHTNMSKAALNMLTLSSAGGLFQDKVLVNAVDTGWVTDMAPGGVGAVAATHATHVGPPLDAVDGAARVLDPIFSHVNEPASFLVRGKFWKDYCVSYW